ncbi:SDR family NAD(P)-dependent oxidoreductase [Sphingomonas arenae]|uniref:SDR family NAD(P)-dependent oxidoreductase n=1 Tax=Sphingomonas arenae TaxID=2812555 RepID=UPI001967ED97|nr:SDR family oxidoreductase [Sphingomonas arenae]
MHFSGTSTLITGAASGIGLATARHLAEHGAGRLILVDRGARALDAIDLPCETLRVDGDVGDPGLWAKLPLRELDHAVVNAGVAGVGPVSEMPFEGWRRVLSTNLDGAFLSLQASLRAMRHGGSVVCVASAAGFKAEKGIGAYAASKAGLIQLARVAAKEVAERKIRVNAIAPGGVETSIWESEEFQHRSSEIGREAAFAEIASMGTPLGRFAKPEEIAAQIAFLLSNETAGTMTGSVLLSDGGYLL